MSTLIREVNLDTHSSDFLAEENEVISISNSMGKNYAFVFAEGI